MENKCDKVLSVKIKVLSGYKKSKSVFWKGKEKFTFGWYITDV